MIKRWLTILLLLSSQAFSNLLTKEGKPTQPFTSILQILEIHPDDPLEVICLELTEACYQAKERWEFEPRFEDKRGVLTPLLKELKIFSRIEASKTQYDYALVLGALRKRAQERIDFLVTEWKRGVRFNQIVFLTGERALRSVEDCPGLHSENEMIEYIWNQTPMPKELRKVPVSFVNSAAPPGTHRTNTVYNVIEWQKQNPPPGTCIAFSSQPYAQYQHQILKSTLPSTFSLETVCEEAKEKQPMSILMDTIARWLMWTTKNTSYKSSH